jgi:hypothetical protein
MTATDLPVDNGVNVAALLGVRTARIDADATPEDIRALVAQSQKRSAVYDILTNPTNVTVDVV